ncbi:MAG: hypothetical protein ACI8Y4_004750 [Candidatus Poriferisodalaceae bacterium]|jgi:hypothetical protein
MGVSVVLDVVIGLVLVFFVFSLVASGIHEAETRMLATRSKQLWRALGTLLDGEIRRVRGMDAAGTRGRAAEVARSV